MSEIRALREANEVLRKEGRQEHVLHFVLVVWTIALIMITLLSLNP